VIATLEGLIEQLRAGELDDRLNPGPTHPPAGAGKPRR
jgi:hypothetical protein